MTLVQFADKFPDEPAARQWFESMVWPDGQRYCPACGSDNTHEASHAKMPYRCRDCHKYFSVKTGTVMAGSPVPLRKWAYAMYLDSTSLKGVASMKLHRDIGVTQKTAWFMLQRIREAYAAHGASVMDGPVEVDETYVGGKRRNMHASECKKLTGRGPVGKTAVVGIRDRNTGTVNAEVVTRTDKPTLQGFVLSRTADGATVYTDDHGSYEGLPNRKHESVRHSVGEYVRGMAHTNAMVSFWSMLKRAHKGTFHKISPKHLHRYVAEFAGRHNVRPLDTIEQMVVLARWMSGRRLTYERLIADNGMPSGARSA